MAKGEGLFDLPNIDALGVTDLQELAAVLRTLQHYAYNKLRATEQRLEGNIEMAARIETVCEKYYEMLPHAYRW